MYIYIRQNHQSLFVFLPVEVDLREYLTWLLLLRVTESNSMLIVTVGQLYPNSHSVNLSYVFDLSYGTFHRKIFLINSLESQ